MFHLLPEKEKKVLEREYQYRILLVALCFVLGSLIVASVFLFPSYILSKRKLDDIKFKNDQVGQEIKAKTDPLLANFLFTLRDNLSALAPGPKNVVSSVYLKDITDKKTDGISLNQFSINNDEVQTIIMSGEANNRDNLIHFYRDLQADVNFSKVELPISDFAKDKEIDFSITLTIKSND